MYTKAIILAALCACASAQIPALLPRKTTESGAEETTSSSPECLSRVQSWAGAVPTPAPELASALDNGAYGDSGVAGLCDFAKDLPKAEASAFTSYNLDMYSYLSAQSSNLVALATSCPGDMGAPPKVITSQLDELLTVYSSFSAGACKKAAATSPTEVSTTTDSSSTTRASTTRVSTTSGSVKIVGVASSTSSSNSSSSSTTASFEGLTAIPTSTNSGSSTMGAGSSASLSSSLPSSSSTSTAASQNAGPRETGMLAAAILAVGFAGAAVVL
ncbi:hypothetical protein F4677DRAFT_126533 [Hypoxylon crocopeplum]|nr:hypothetical protein F4677DRAFT_126533 [Hypoxylon crocopeplum]